jgi:hypothetical protein
MAVQAMRGSVVLAIDPGPTQSAYVLMVEGTVLDVAKLPNETVLSLVRNGLYDALVIEWITVASVAGAEVYQTCRWIGRYEQASAKPVTLLPRSDVLLHLFGKRNVKSADALVRRAMLDRYGGDSAKGRKAAPGPLYGFHADCWQALGVAVTYQETT